MKQSILLSLALAALAGLALAGLGHGATASVNLLSAKLNAKQEVPRQTTAVPAATGTFSGKLTGRTLTWRLTYSHLSGRAIGAHIHLGKPGVAGRVVVSLCGRCESGLRGSATVSRGVADRIIRGTTYVNVHTAKNKSGEIRGQLRARAG